MSDEDHIGRAVPGWSAEAVERMAHIIDPYAFRSGVEYDLLDKAYQAKALTKARLITAVAVPLPDPPEVTG